MGGRPGEQLNSKTFGSGKDIVFLHGWGGDVSAFLFVADKLQFRHRVTVLDFAGFGASKEPSYAYGVRDYAEDVAHLLKSEGIRRATFVGHSFGGRVAIELAAFYPHLVERLVLIDSAGILPRRTLKYHLRVYSHKLMRRLGLKGLKGSPDFEKLSPIMKETFKKVVNYDQTPYLSAIKVPTAIFWGNKDVDTPLYMARIINDGIKNSELYWLDGAHYAYVDDFATFFALLTTFLHISEKDIFEVK